MSLFGQNMRSLPSGAGARLKGEELAALEKRVGGWNVIEEQHITKTFKCPMTFREPSSRKSSW